jgi:SAM-dependent methyltransferase
MAHWTAVAGGVKRRVGRPYRRLQRRAARRLFESGPHDTSEQVELVDFDLDRQDLRRYEASGWFYLHRALRGVSITARDVFVDFGSGKGRVVAQAARYPFGRVVGVEISEDLTAMARANIEDARPRLACQDIELVTSDALSYDIPADMTMAYLHNPFGGEVFQRVIDRIIHSVDRSPRQLTLIYVNPVMADYVRDTGRFDLVRRSRGLRPDVASRRIHVYVSRPVASAAGEETG